MASDNQELFLLTPSQLDEYKVRFQQSMSSSSSSSSSSSLGQEELTSIPAQLDEVLVHQNESHTLTSSPSLPQEEGKFILTPAQLNEGKTLLYPCDFAIICFRPLPTIFYRYNHDIYTEDTDDRPFTHVHSSHIMYCFVKDVTFIVLAEVYGAPVGAATLEDLHSYGINKVFAFGYAGSLTKEIEIGENVYAASAYPDEDVTKHYVDVKEGEHIIAKEKNILEVKECSVWTIGHFYRQTREQVEKALKLKCQIVNMDTSHFYSVCESLNIMGYYYCTISDTYAEKWNNHLSKALSGDSLLLDIQNSLINGIIHYECNDNIDVYKYKMGILLLDVKLCRSHNVEHFYKVYNNAVMALKEENSNKVYFNKAILLAALLHDIDDPKLFPNSKNNINARTILHGFSDEYIELVIEMINLVSFSANGNSTVEDARKLLPRHCDRLEAIGKTGIQRCYQYTKTIKRPIIKPETPRATTMEELNKLVREYKGPDDCFITHFYCKLLKIDTTSITNQYLSLRFKQESAVMFKFILDFFNKVSINNDVVDDDVFIQNYINSLPD
jgi:uncharacterized protein